MKKTLSYTTRQIHLIEKLLDSARFVSCSTSECFCLDYHSKLCVFPNSIPHQICPSIPDDYRTWQQRKDTLHQLSFYYRSFSVIKQNVNNPDEYDRDFPKVYKNLSLSSYSINKRINFLQCSDFNHLCTIPFTEAQFKYIIHTAQGDTKNSRLPSVNSNVHPSATLADCRVVKHSTKLIRQPSRPSRPLHFTPRTPSAVWPRMKRAANAVFALFSRARGSVAALLQPCVSSLCYVSPILQGQPLCICSAAAVCFLFVLCESYTPGLAALLPLCCSRVFLIDGIIVK